MPSIEVKTTKLSSFAETTMNVAGKVDDIEASFLSIMSNLDWDIKSTSNIQSSTTQISIKLNNSRDSLKKTANFFMVAKREYEKLDQLELPEALQDGLTLADKIADSSEVDGDNFWSDLLGKIWEEVGFFGKISSEIGSIFGSLFGDGTFSWKDGLDTASSLWGIFGESLNLGKVFKVDNWNISVDWKEFFGLDKVNVSDHLMKDLGKYTDKGVHGLVKWGSVIFDGLISGYENYNEYNDKLGTADEMTKTDAWLETFTETGVKVGIGVLAKVAVATAFGAVAAPSALVGTAVVVTTVGVTWGLNYFYDLYGGKEENFAEGVSALVTDVKDLAVDIGGKVIDGAIGLAESAKNTIAGWFK